MLLNGLMILFSIWCLFGLIGAGFIIAEDTYNYKKDKFNWPTGFKILLIFIYILLGLIVFLESIEHKSYKYGWKILDLNKYN